MRLILLSFSSFTLLCFNLLWFKLFPCKILIYRRVVLFHLLGRHVIKLRYNLHTAFCSLCHLLILDHVAFISLAWVIYKLAFIFPHVLCCLISTVTTSPNCAHFNGQLCVRNGCEYMNLNHTLELWLKSGRVDPSGRTLDFKSREGSNGGKNQNPKIPLGLPTIPPKIPGTKINP